MRLIFKLCILALAGFLLLPLSAPSMTAGGPDSSHVPAAVTETVADLSRFCVRQPDACRTARTALQSAGAVARDLAGIAYPYLDSQYGTAKQNKEPSVTEAAAR